MPKPSTTTNRLHFNDLDPLRFEDLCLNIVSRIESWTELNHFGRKGSDGGVDIFAKKIENGNEINWAIQCKRYAKFSKVDLQKIVDTIVTNSTIPNKLLIIVSCDVSKLAFDFVKKYSSKNGIGETFIWTASTLEAKLYKDFPDLLFVYFGVRIQNKTESNITRIKHSLRMEKRVLKDLIDNKYIKELKNYSILSLHPESKFISQRVFIRSVDDNTYPNVEDLPSGVISAWFKTNFYDTYHNGIEFWLSAASGTSIIMDEEGYWEPLFYYNDPRRKNPKYTEYAAKLIGRIPYFNIVEYKLDGDEYSSEPHIYCKFNFDGMPYERIYYKLRGNPEKGIRDRDLEDSMRKIFPPA